MHKLYSFLITFSFSLSALAADNTKIHQVINKYRNSPAVKMNLNKTVTMELLGETKKSSGNMYLSSNKMRYEINKPENHLIVMGDKNIWIENRLPKKLGGKIQVTHLKSTSGQNKVKGFLAAFFGNRNIKEDMTFSETSKNNFTISFKRKNKDLEYAKIGIDESATQIKYIEYKDKYKTITRHVFSSVKFKKSVDKDKFIYQPPKKAEVTVM